MVDREDDLKNIRKMFPAKDFAAYRVSMHRDETDQDEINAYVACVVYMAAWFEKQDGAAKKDTCALFEEFKENVVETMRRGAPE